jgi:hypothetical protein
LKFADESRRGNSAEKYSFSGISETAQANFKQALIFWLLLYQDKSNKEKTHFDQAGTKWRPRSTGS